jgi:predicted nucleic acid-binding protein
LRAKRVVVDTNVIIRHRLSAVPGIVSAVVLQELAAGARDTAEVRRLGSMRAVAEDDGVLLTPDGEDWYFAGKVLNSLYRGLRSRRMAGPQAISREEQQRLVRDVLIARSAKRVNAGLVTYNAGDFEKIQRFCNVRLVPPERFL